jgi:hypothetical protein
MLYEELSIVTKNSNTQQMLMNIDHCPERNTNVASFALCPDPPNYRVG